VSILVALKGINGTFELNRLVGAFGATAFVVTSCGLVAFDVIVRGVRFDIAAFCLAFPTGLGVAVGSIAGAVALKDRQVAKAKAVEQNTADQAASGSATDLSVGA
jgi:hypothetical protein